MTSASTMMPASPHGYTLLTGSTGSIGNDLLCDLLRAQLPVAVLVRSKAGTPATARIERQICRMESHIGRRLVRPVVLDGDLSRPGLGLLDSDRQWVADYCGRVLHSAANLSFAPANQHPDNEPFRTNVQGTRNLLHICREAGLREFHYVSTAYVCGLQTGSVGEVCHNDDRQFANDYERSKAQAERMLHECPDLDSLTIYRPSIVVDDSMPSAPRQADQAIPKAFATYQFLSSRFGLPKPGAWLKNLNLTGSERKNIVQAAWVARMIVQILRRPPLHGAIYHLTSSTGTTVQSLEAGFRNAVTQNCSDRASSTANGSLLDKLAAPYVATFQPYFRDDPQFDQTNLREALAVCGEPPCPEVGVAQITRIATAQWMPSQRGGEVGNPEIQKENLAPLSIERLLTSGRELTDNTAGLLLSGLNGGTWTVAWDSQKAVVLRGIRSDVTTRIYTSATLLMRLMERSVTVNQAIATGKLLVECDVDDSMNDDAVNRVRECLQRLGQSLLELEEQTVKDEVAHAR
ncbi:MAG: SDR family oxidoreductase [Planctomycetaceae bacterium]